MDPLIPRSTSLGALTPGSGRPGGSRPGSSRPGSSEGGREGGQRPLSRNSSRGQLEPLAAPPPPPAPAAVPKIPTKFQTAVRAVTKQLDESENAETQRGPMKWVPHTHSNPKHAKFCFICLHGKLQGQTDGTEDEVKRQQQLDEDLPSPVEMRELAYLMPQSATGGNFRRASANFDNNNITAMWLRDVTSRVYDETVKVMMAEQNSDLDYRVDVKLADPREDEVDRQALTRLFTLSKEEQAVIDRKTSWLGEWCANEENRLMDIMPPARERGNLPEVEEPDKRHYDLLEYKPLLDTASLKGQTGVDIRDAMATLEDALSGGKQNAKVTEIFKAEDLPAPDTYPDMPEFEVIPYPITLKDIPNYEPLRPAKPARHPIEASPDPFERPSLYRPDMEEKVLPKFETRGQIGMPRPLPASCPTEEMLAKTRSIFPENNPVGERFGWGLVPERQRFMPAFVDEPYMPPLDLVGSVGGNKKLLTRRIWDPELVTTRGDMVPPLKQRGEALYQEPTFHHPNTPVWTTELVPMKPRTEKIREIIPIMPVKSYTKFKPKKVHVELPDFIWDLARQEAGGQGVWDVMEQRHMIPRNKKNQEEKEQAQRKKEQAEAEEILKEAEVKVYDDAELTGAAPLQGPSGNTMAAGDQRTFGTSIDAGIPTTMRPDPPSFVDSADDASRAQLPRALQGRMRQKDAYDTSGQDAPTMNDVNMFTQEKMRGECYVRLLIKPEEQAARKDPIPYSGEQLTPEVSILGQSRPNVRVPPAPPKIDEETGELEQEDMFADFERDDSVIFSFVRHNRYDAVEEILIQEPEVVFVEDESKNSLLITACQNDHRRMAKLLMKMKADVNHQNKRGNTALHFCYQYNFMQLAEYLVSYGADENLCNYFGLAPAQGTGAEEEESKSMKNLSSKVRGE